MHDVHSPLILVGTLVNAAGIVGGGIAYFIWKKTPAGEAQQTCRTALAILTVLAGLHLYWVHINGGFWAGLRQNFLIMVSLSFGSLTGHLMGLQQGSNRLGQYATRLMEKAIQSGERPFQDGFLTAVILFCLAPLSILGAVQEGLVGDWRSFAIKTCVDSLGATAFVGIFGARVLWVLMPVVAWQGSLTLGFKILAPWLIQHGLLDAVMATSGMLLCTVSLQLAQVGRIRVTDYLPSLVIAPALTALWVKCFG